MTMRPDRYRNAIVPHICVDGAADGIAFYKRELFRMAHTNGKSCMPRSRSPAQWS